MRNLIAIIAAILLLAGAVALLMCCGMLDTPGYPIGPAIVMGIISIALSGAGGLLANLYERGKI